jgi:flagellar motor switch protein FliM
MSVSQSSEQSEAADGEQGDGASVEQTAVAEPAGERIRTLDFSEPTKFTAELTRRVVRVLDPFADALAAVLSSELKANVEVKLGDSLQVTWAAGKAQLPADSIAVAVVPESIDRHMLLSVELPFVLQALECMLGGDASQAPSERHMTEIDWVLARGLLDSIVRQLAVAWEDLGGPDLRRGDVDTEGDAGVLAPIGEPTFAVTLESSIDGLASVLSLLIPWAAFEPVAERIRGAGSLPQDADPTESAALRRGLAGAHVLLRAEVGSVQMPLERMLELLPGVLVPLGERAEDGVRLFAEDASLGRGRPGRSGTRRAIKLETTSELPSRAETYATLGRAELERARAQVDGGGESAESKVMLRSIFVRIWAELGRTHLPLGRALELTQGAVVDLDQGAESPVELFANGLCFARGNLVVTGEGEWAVQVEALV